MSRGFDDLEDFGRRVGELHRIDVDKPLGRFEIYDGFKSGPSQTTPCSSRTLASGSHCQGVLLAWYCGTCGQIWCVTFALVALIAMGPLHPIAGRLSIPIVGAPVRKSGINPESITRV